MTVRALQLIIIVQVAAGFFEIATGEEITKIIKDRYNNVADKCNDSSGNEKPAYECSGIMIRGVNNKDRNLEFGWSMKALNKQKEAFSLAYLRRDQVFSRFPKDCESGFIIYPHLSTPSKKNTYKVFCSFPMDAHTDARDGHGCGKSSSDTTGKSSHCDTQNIKSLDSWKSHYTEIMNSRDKNFVIRQCGFDMTITSAAKDFALSLEANRYIQSQSTKYAFRNNELRMHAWNEMKAENIPIEAFFYLIGSAQGKSLAEKYQDEFYDRSGGEIVPIVGISLPAAQKELEVSSYSRIPQKRPPNDYQGKSHHHRGRFSHAGGHLPEIGSRHHHHRHHQHQHNHQHNNQHQHNHQHHHHRHGRHGAHRHNH